MFRPTLARLKQAFEWLLTQLALLLLLAYRCLLSPLIGGNCRFNPSCSEYAWQAIKTHGVWRGSWLALKRLGKCHPWHAGGEDRVP